MTSAASCSCLKAVVVGRQPVKPLVVLMLPTIAVPSELFGQFDAIVRSGVVPRMP